MTSSGTWQPTACILCECNCGIEVLLGEDGRTFARSAGQAASRVAGVHVRQGPAPGPLPERPSRAADRRRCGATRRRLRGDRLGHGHRGDSRPADGRARRPRRGDDLLLRRRRAGQPPRRGPLDGDHGRVRCPLPLQRAGPGEDRRVLGQRPRSLGNSTRADFEHCEVALFLGKNPWPVPRLPAGTRRPEGDRQRSERSMIVVDPRRTETADLADIHLQVRPGTDLYLITRSGGGPRAVGPGRPRVDRGTHRRFRCRRRRAGPRAGGVSTARRRRRGGPGARRRRADRRGGVGRRLRGPRRADEPRLHAGQLRGEAGLVADRQLRQARRPVRAVQPLLDRARPWPTHRRRAAQPGGRRADLQRSGPVQRHRRGDPGRPSRPLPGR